MSSNHSDSCGGMSVKERIENVEWEWVSVNAWGLAIPALSRWARESSDPLVLTDEHARLDVRREVNGAIVDPAYLRRVRARFGGSADSALVRVQGRAAIRTIAQRANATLLTYAIADVPVVNNNDLNFPEWRLAYVLAGAPRAMLDAITSRLEDSDPGWEALVAAHPLTDEGHLRFGPVPVPAHFRLLREDGGLLKLPGAGRNARNIEVAAGWIVLVGPKDSSGGEAKLIFRPQWIGGQITESVFTSFVRDRSQEVERVTGRRVVIAESSICRVRFALGTVGLVRWRTEGNGVVDVRATFVWQDVLGYQWEIAYVLPAAQRSQLNALVAGMRAETV